MAEGRRSIGFDRAGRRIGGRPANGRPAGRKHSTQPGCRRGDLRIAVGDWSTVSGEDGLRCLLSRQPGPGCVFVANDQMALGALRTAHLAARRVPDDLAVVGFDDLPESPYFWPPLTTVCQSLR